MIKDDSAKVEKSSGNKFTKGTPKPINSGRKKGTPNKDKKELRDRLNAEFPNYDPLLSLAAIGNDPKTPLEMKITCHKEIAKYIHPQRKAVEIANDIELPPIKIEGIKV